MILINNIGYLQPYKPGMVKVFCDNKPVVDMLNRSNRDVPIEQGALKMYWIIVSLGISIQHVKGSENTIADALSRYRKKIDINSKTDKQEIKVNQGHEDNNDNIKINVIQEAEGKRRKS